MTPVPGGEVIRALPALAAELNREHEACEASYCQALDHAIRAGQLLVEAKDQLAHGEWLPWLEQHFRATPRTAQGYMLVARRAQEVKRVSHLPVREVLRSLQQPRNEDPEPRPAPPSTTELPNTSDEVGMPAPPVSFRTGVARKTWGDIRERLAEGDLKISTLRDVRELVPEVQVDLLREAAAAYAEAAEDLRGLADHLLRERRR